MSQVQQFYSGRNIFITGGTGFLGIILVEKLLRSCPETGTIYLLIRGKKGKSVQERVDALFANSVFDVVRSYYPDFLKKIVGIPGDIAEEGLGLSTADRARLVDEVSVIFHLAATVRFNEELGKAVAINVNGAKSVVDIAKECKNLKVAIHVSTAYSNCVYKLIEEKLYPAPLSYAEVNELVEDARKTQRTEEEMEEFTKGVLGEWPNTYTFTKAIAEGVLAEFAEGVPFAIFRPSIVSSIYKEPVPGWLCSPMGQSGLYCVSGLGIMHAGFADVNIKFDLVPVDYVCNALITCAWETAISERYDKDIPVYNYVSGNENSITLRQLNGKASMYGYLFPSEKAIYYPSTVILNSKLIFLILNFFLNLIPALIVDNIARLFGKEIGLSNVIRKITAAQYALSYFSTQQWDFENQRVQNLWKRITPEDREKFPFSMQTVDWDEHMMKLVRGLRKYIAGDPDGNERKARRRHFCLYVIHTIVRLTFWIFILWITWKVFCGRSLSTVYQRTQFPMINSDVTSLGGM